MSFDLRDGIVRILKPNGETAGTGFVLTTDGLIATCSHVVQSNQSQKRGEPKPEKATIVFHATGESREAQIEPNWWCSSHRGEDVAILRVKGDLPEGVKSLPLGSSKGTGNHPFDSFGFPKSNPEGGIWGDGHILGETEIQDILVRQLKSHQVSPGFSGAPVVDRLRRRVVGMVTSITPPDEYGRQAETAFITPIETLRDVCSVLKLSDICPYRNLEAFTEADATFFHGRERVIEMLIDNLQNEPRFLAVFGASGSGKSSVVQAGLIPQLRNGALPGSDRWDIIVIRPTDAFFKQHLAHLDQVSASVALVIDQFEELFVSYDEKASLEVITQLTHLLEYSPHVALLIVMRDDFYSLLVRQEKLAMWLKSHVVNVSSILRHEEVESIVREPAELIGWQFEERLVETIVDDVLATSAKGHKKGESSESSTILPLLEFTLTQLWERRQDGILTYEAYSRIGRVTGGLRQWADEAYYKFEVRLRPLVRRTFTELVHLGDEEQHIADSRRRRPLSTLIYNDAERTDISQIVQQLVADRLLVTSQDQKSKQETVEIIHDALLWEWGLLKGWVKEDRTFLRWHQKIEEQTQEWVATNIDHSTKREAGKLLRGSDLEVAKDWLTKRKADLSLQEQDFIKASSMRRIQFVMSMIVILFMLVSTMGIAAGLYLTEPPKPPSPTLVTTLQDNTEPGSLRWCINNASSGSTIRFARGIIGTIKLKGDLVFASGKRLTITGPGASQLTISGGNTNASIDVSPSATVTLTGLSFKNSSETAAGAFLYNQGTLTVTHSIISGNKSTSDGQNTGGGIQNTSTGSLTVMDTIISHNSVSGQQQGQGGGIDNSGKLTVTDSTFANNIATSSGGIAIGGGIVNTQTGTVMVTGSTFSNNSASGQQYGQGGGIDNEGKLSVVNSTFANNTATGSSVAGFGGGISNSQTGTVMVTGSTFSNNSASGQQQGQGGGIDNEGKLTVTDSTFANNTAISSNNTALGGGIRNYRTGTVMVTGSTFSRNSASGQQNGQGGGIFTSGKLTMVNSTFSNNIATSSGGIGQGGGIYNYQTGTVKVTGSTFSHNSTSGKQEDAGGGISTDGKLTIINSTLSNNTASGGKSYGGGIGFTGSHGFSTLIRFSTLYANTSGTDGGGIWINPTGSSHLTISSSIIAANKASDGPDISGTLISDGYNLLTNITGVTGLNARTDRQVTLSDLKLDSTLRNNGGPTQTLALLQESPAIDYVPGEACSIAVTDISGHTMTITTDQRGDRRPDGSENACDIGAFESSYQG